MQSNKYHVFIVILLVTYFLEDGRKEGQKVRREEGRQEGNQWMKAGKEKEHNRQIHVLYSSNCFVLRV